MRACRRVEIAFQIRGFNFEFDESSIAQGIDELRVRESPWICVCVGIMKPVILVRCFDLRCDVTRFTHPVTSH